MVPYPKGRGSKEKSCLRWMPNEILKMDVYEEYLKQWSPIDTVSVETESSTISIPLIPLCKDLFCHV